MLTTFATKKKREDFSFIDALCKALGWFFPLLAKFNVQSVEKLIYRKYPYVCPYCRKTPHQDNICKTVKGTTGTVDHEAVNNFYNTNLEKLPKSLDEWQTMFQAIYPRATQDTSSRSVIGLFEELGELAEAIRVFDRYPKYFAGEVADVFSYIMGIANDYNLRLELDEKEGFSFESEYLLRYPGLCIQCGHQICICPSVPESTVGRLSKEIDLKENNGIFSPNLSAIYQNGPEVCSLALEKVGGYRDLVESFPFDRGEANRALILLCLRLADAMEPRDQNLAAHLRGSAIRIGNATAEPGSKTRAFSAKEIIETIIGVGRNLGEELSQIIQSDDQSVINEIGLTLEKYRVLMVIANPADTESIDVYPEANKIRDAISTAPSKSFISLDILPASSIDDFRRSLLDNEYDIIHFSGHGTDQTLIFQDSGGNAEPAVISGIAALLKDYPRIKCILLNACYALKYLTEPIAPITIGMENGVDDDAAIEFSRGFYESLARGQKIEDAIRKGVTNVEIKGLKENFPIKILPADCCT